MLAHKNEYYYQNPSNIGENLFAWVMPGGGASGVRYSGMHGNDYSPFGGRKSSSSLSKTYDHSNQLSGKNVADYWYKTRQYYDYTKNPNVLHAHAGILVLTSHCSILIRKICMSVQKEIHFNIFLF